MNFQKLLWAFFTGSARRRLLALSLFVGTSLLGSGCEKRGAQSQTPTTNTPIRAATNALAGFAPTNAQPKLRTVKLWLGPQELTAELALSLPQIMTGMMFRKQMGEHEGMLFVFGRAHRASFYMRNTLIPLSCAYIDHDGTILEIHDMKPLDESPIEAHSDNVQFVLEVKQGWFARNKVGAGSVVRTEFGSLPDTFLKQ